MNPKTQEKINELVDLFAASLRVECERLYRSGAVDVESYDPDHYALPKILVTAAILRRKDDFAPLLDNKGRHKRTIENLTRI